MILHGSIIFLLSSCEKNTKATTFQVINDMEPWETDIPELNGTMYGADMYCFSSPNVFEIVSLGTLAPGDSSAVFTVDKEFIKLKVSCKFLPGSKVFQDRYWIFRFYDVVYHYLEKNEHHEIIFDEHTMMHPKLLFAEGNEELTVEDILLQGPSGLQVLLHN